MLTFLKNVCRFTNASLAIEDTIRSASYTGQVTIEYCTSGERITIRPNTMTSKALSSDWIGPLVSPLTRLYGYYSGDGLGKWDVCGAAYALKRVSSDGSSADGSPARVETIAGMREGEWLRLWEHSIQHAVTSHAVHHKTLALRNKNPAHQLDGYLSPQNEN